MKFLLNFFLWKHLRKWAKKTVTTLDDEAVDLLEANVSRVIDREITVKDGLMQLIREGLQIVIRYWNNHRDNQNVRSFLITIQKLIGSLDLNEK